MVNERSKQFGGPSQYGGPSQNRPGLSHLSETINVLPVASRVSQLGIGLGKGAGGLGKGVAGGKGKELGKGGLKRYMKIQRDNIYGVTKGDIRRLARRGGVKRISATPYDDVRQALKERLQMILRDICAILGCSGRKTVSVTDFGSLRASHLVLCVYRQEIEEAGITEISDEQLLFLVSDGERYPMSGYKCECSISVY